MRSIGFELGKKLRKPLCNSEDVDIRVFGKERRRGRNEEVLEMKRTMGTSAVCPTKNLTLMVGQAAAAVDKDDG